MCSASIGIFQLRCELPTSFFGGGFNSYFLVPSSAFSFLGNPLFRKLAFLLSLVSI